MKVTAIVWASIMGLSDDESLHRIVENRLKRCVRGSPSGPNVPKTRDAIQRRSSRGLTGLFAPFLAAVAACADAAPQPAGPEPAAAVATEDLSGARADGFEILRWGLWQDSAFLVMAPAIRAASARWEEILASSDPWAVDAGVMYCPGVPGTTVRILQEVDDIVILFQRVRIDGPGQTLAQAAACVVRSRGFLPPFGPPTFEYLPVYGIVQVDDADVTDLSADGRLEEVILHEIGHALGLGNQGWLTLGLVDDARPPGSVLYHDTHFTGANAVEAFDGIGGASYDGGKVPVDNRGLQFTAHWRESVMGSELMTPFYDGSPSPLSIVTAMSLVDLGYSVDPRAVDRYSLPATGPDADRGLGVPYGDDILPVVPLVVGSSGPPRYRRGSPPPPLQLSYRNEKAPGAEPRRPALPARALGHYR